MSIVQVLHGSSVLLGSIRCGAKPLVAWPAFAAFAFLSVVAIADDCNFWDCYEYTGELDNCENDGSFILYGPVDDPMQGEGCTGTCDNWDPNVLTCDNDELHQFDAGSERNATWVETKNTDPFDPLKSGFCLDHVNYFECFILTKCKCVQDVAGTLCVKDENESEVMYGGENVLNTDSPCLMD